MRDDEYRPAMHQLVHAALYNDLGAGINAGGGFIKNHHGWIGDCRPCDGNELALPLRKIAAITGKDSIIAIRQMGERLKVTHIHNNFKFYDLHLTPDNGNIDWKSVMTALAEVGYDGPLTLETHCLYEDELLMQAFARHNFACLEFLERLQEKQ